MNSKQRTYSRREDIHSFYGGRRYYFHRRIYVDELGWEYRTITVEREGVLIHSFHSAIQHKD